jgi:hypothetical protein
MDTITPEALSGAAGILLSLAFSYIPGLNVWYAKFNDEQKKLLMVLFLALTATGAYGLACAGILQDLFGLGLGCDKASALILLRSFIFAAVTNQTTYKLTPQTKKVKIEKEKMDVHEERALQ